MAATSLIGLLLSALLFTGFGILLLGLLLLVAVVEGIRIIQGLTLLIYARYAQDPVPMEPEPNLRVAVLTTIVPGKEPFELVAHTLRQMKKLEHEPGTKVDVWLLDEGNDTYVRRQCYAMGVKHFSRKGIKQFNTQSGEFKARTKHGNHNAWRSRHEDKYDIVAQMDPDHVPRKDFLTRTLGYFADPDVAFVVAPQVYGNLKDNWIAKASAFQAYVFHGIIQRGGNGMHAPLLIGTNHLYRVRAFKQIGGYQDSIIEDHLTSMVVYGTTNETGAYWRGVYTPDILAVGEGPASFTDYFNQQKRWAYGIWEIIQKATGRALRKMGKRQALSFLMLQFFYPSVAVSWVLSSLVTVMFGFIAVTYQNFGPLLLAVWGYSILSSLALFFWLRKFNLVEHERKDWGLQGMALLLMCIPVYVSAGAQALLRKPLTYAVTAKGNKTSPDTLDTFAPHMNWITLNLAGLAVLAIFNPAHVGSSTFWLYEHMAICASPIAVYAIGRYEKHRRTIAERAARAMLPSGRVLDVPRMAPRSYANLITIRNMYVAPRSVY